MSIDPRFAEPTPFQRLLYTHAVSVAGDACLTVSLAGSLFFQNPAGAAREKVLLYLALTMAPFAIVAPILGPALVDDKNQLVNANSRLALMSVIAASVGGIPAAAIQHLFGADWSLRVAAIVFAVAAVLAFQIPRARTAVHTDPADERVMNEELHQPSILLAGSSLAVLRGSVGFLAFFTAFALKDDLFALGVALGAGAVGGFVGVVVAPIVRRTQREEVIVASALVTPAVLTLLGALMGGTFGFMLAAFSVAVGAAAGRLGFDSLLQRDGPDAVRGRAFARFETRFQLVWVIGGLIGLIPIAAKFGLFVLSMVLLGAAISYIGALRASRRRVMRTKLLPESVDRAITRSRDHAFDRVRRRFRKTGTGTGTE